MFYGEFNKSALITNTKVQGDLLLCNIEKVTLGVRILVCCGGLLYCCNNNQAVVQQQWSSLITNWKKYRRGPQTSRKNRGPPGVRGVRWRTPGVRKLGPPLLLCKILNDFDEV